MSLNTTTTRAHVCTDPAADPGQTTYIAIPVPAEPIPLSGRRFWAIDLDDTPPPGVINPAGITLRAGLGISDTRPADSNRMDLHSRQGAFVLRVSRHKDDIDKQWSPAKSRCWTGFEERLDASGAKWIREVHCVTNDHGWLVEVPAC